MGVESLLPVLCICMGFCRKERLAKLIDRRQGHLTPTWATAHHLLHSPVLGVEADSIYRFVFIGV